MRWKWVLGIAAVLIIALVMTVYLILASYDYNRLKPWIAEVVKDTTGRELMLGGDIELAIGFSPSLVVADVTFANAPWGSQPHMIKADRLQARVKLFPLLFGDVEVRRIALLSADVFLETDKTGHGNWEFKTGEESTKSFWTLKELEIETVRIVKFKFTFRDGKTGSRKRFALDELNAAEQPFSDELKVELKGTSNGQPVVISGQTGLIRNLLAHKPLEVDLSGKVSGAEIKVDGVIGDVLKLDGINLKVHASGTDLEELAHAAGVALLETDAFTVAGHLKGSSEALTFEDAAANVSRGSVELTINGNVGDLISLSGIDLALKGSGKDLAEISPIVETTLPQTGPYTVTGRLTGSSKALSLQDAQGSVSRDNLRLDVQGKVKDLLSFSGIDLRIKAKGKEAAEVGQLMGTELPELGSFNVSGHLTGSTKTLALDGLSVNVGKSDFNGSAKLEFRKRPKITLALESGLVDFTPLIGEAKKDEKELAGKGESDRRLFPEDPLPLDVLKKLDADIVLKAKRMRARKAQFDLGHLALTLEDSELAIDKLKAVYKGAKISGNIHIYPGSPPDVATKFLVQDFDLGNYLREIGALDKAEGHVDIAADLKSRGDSAHTLAANLDGTIGFVMGQGYLTKWLDLIAVDLSKEVIPFWGKHEKKGGRINCAIVEWDIKSGLATSQAFVFDTEVAILTAKGDINLETEEVDLLLSPQPKDLSLTTLNTKLRVSGTIQNPKVRPDKASLAAKGAKALSVFVIGPVGLLAPFVSLGAHQKHPCDIEKKTDQSEK